LKIVNDIPNCIISQLVKKLLTILILLYHVNFFMFIPQLDEVDQYDANGKLIDDINSLTGYVDQVVFGHKHSSPNDEDDDSARYFQVTNIDNYNFQQQIIESIKPNIIPGSEKKYPSHIERKISPVYFEIQSPPPEI